MKIPTILLITFLLIVPTWCHYLPENGELVENHRNRRELHEVRRLRADEGAITETPEPTSTQSPAPAPNGISRLINLLLAPVRFLGNLLRSIVTTVINSVRAVVSGIFSFVRPLVGAVMAIPGHILNGISQLAKSIGNLLRQIFGFVL